MQKILIIMSLFFLLALSVNVYAQGSQGKKLDVVVIDPGHGGKDPGAVGKMAKEKDIVLSVALKLGNLIKKNYPNVKVIYTRDKDVFVELGERASIANRNNADLFISVHVNSVDGSSSSHGTETFVMGLHKNDANLAVAKRENSVILQEDNYSSKYDGFDPNAPESNIIFSLFQNAYSDQSLLLAASIEDEFKSSIKRFDRGVKQAGFLVLWKTAMPSVLTELGFISNPEEEQYLKSDVGQTELAISIYNAFAKYKSQYDNSAVYLEKIPYRQSTQAKEEQKPESEPGNDSQESQQLSQSQQKSDEYTKTEVNNPKEQVSTTESTNGIWFKVQIRMSPKELEVNEKTFGKYFDKVSYYIHDGSYKYTVGAETDYNAILKFFHEVKPSYPGCFIIALKDGKRMDLNEAIKATKK